MPRPTLFSVAETKLRRVRDELGHLDRSLCAAKEAGFDDSWSRSATIAFALHGAYTGIEDVMSDIARTIDDFLPIGGMSHQALLDQMRVALDGRRPALLDDTLFRQLVELKGFRHLVRHHYGVDLIPDRTDAALTMMIAALDGFEAAIARLEAVLTESESDP